MPRNFVLLAAIVLAGVIACENEEEKRSRLHRSVDSSEQALQERQKEWERLLEEKQKIEQSSAKERFAFLQKFAKNQWKPCKNGRYVCEIEFEGPLPKKNQYEYIANVRFNIKDMPGKPYFLIHIYNTKGLLLGSCKEEKTRIAQAEKQYKITTDSAEEPAYFRVELMDEFQ